VLCSHGWKRLEQCVADFASQPQLTALVPDITEVDPDDAFSSVPYEKGFSLLYTIEQIVSFQPLLPNP
jgi:leukotriene-A4 hydrolase